MKINQKSSNQMASASNHISNKCRI